MNNPLEIGKNINYLSINNEHILNEFFYLIRNEFNDSILILDNFKELDAKKYSIFIPSPFEININSKKNLMLLYKEEFESLSIDNINKFERINSDIIAVLEDIKIKSFYDLDFDTDITPTKIFELFNLRFSEDMEYNFFEYFKKYIDVCSKLINLKIIFTYDILHLLNDYQIDILNEILDKNDIKLLDISFNRFLNKREKLNELVFVNHIDDDFSEY